MTIGCGNRERHDDGDVWCARCGHGLPVTLEQGTGHCPCCGAVLAEQQQASGQQVDCPSCRVQVNAEDLGTWGGVAGCVLCLARGVVRSKGHLEFIGPYEYVQFPSGDVYRARVSDTYIQPNGYRSGLRFETTQWNLETALRLARETWPDPNVMTFPDAVSISAEGIEIPCRGCGVRVDETVLVCPACGRVRVGV